LHLKNVEKTPFFDNFIDVCHVPTRNLASRNWQCDRLRKLVRILHFFIRTRGLVLLKILEQIKNDPASSEKQVSNFRLKDSEQNSSKCCTINNVHFASRLFTYNC